MIVIIFWSYPLLRIFSLVEAYSGWVYDYVSFLGCVYLRDDLSDCDEFLSTPLSLVGILWLSFYKD